MIYKKRCNTHGHVDHDTYHGCLWCKDMAEERGKGDEGPVREAKIAAILDNLHILFGSWKDDPPG